MKCPFCQEEIQDGAIKCKHCGSMLVNTSQTAPSNQVPASGKEPKEFVTTLILCIFLGGFGVHSFYTGRTGIGIAQLFTLGGCGIWTIIDIISIATGKYRDGNGMPLKK